MLIRRLASIHVSVEATLPTTRESTPSSPLAEDALPVIVVALPVTVAAVPKEVGQPATASNQLRTSQPMTQAGRYLTATAVGYNPIFELRICSLESGPPCFLSA
jgi:hypothetical protein